MNDKESRSFSLNKALLGKECNRDLNSSFLEKEDLFKYLMVIIPLIFLIFLPLIVPYPTILIEILIYSLFAMAFNIYLGYTGYLSFGHATFFGLGAYGAGIPIVRLGVSVWVALLIGALTGACIAWLVGFFALRRRGIYFGMITLAFSQMFYFICLQWGGLTGGSDGLKGIPALCVKKPFFIDLTDPLSLYYFVFFFIVVSIFIIWRILHSPFGKAMQAIRENEERAKACGYNTQRIKLFSFIISGLFSGLAGALYTVFLEYVPLELLYWIANGQVVVVTILGGVGTMVGPFTGSFAFIALRESIVRFTGRWELFVGTIFVICVLIFPKGIYGTLKEKFKSVSSHWIR